MSASAPPPRTAQLALWRVAQGVLDTLYTLFGAPEDVARAHTFVRESHARLASWLRCAEAMLRRLLLIEASAYAKPNTRLAAPKRGEGGPLLTPARRRVPKLMGFDAESPEAWRVSFRVLDKPRRRAGAAASSKRGPAQRFRSAWPLAERYEALIRVFNDPAAYARRLSRRLHATPHRLAEALRAPHDAEHRVDRFEALTHAAETAWRPRFSSA